MLSGLLGLILYELPYHITHSQQAQLSQRGRATLCVIENFTNLLKVVR